MKVKHNKKRNTAFIFEALTREMTRAVISQDIPRVKVIKGIVREHFAPAGLLYHELDCYEAVVKTEQLDRPTAEKILFHAKRKYENLDMEQIFTEQTAVINKINRNLGKNFFNTFIPNYKEYATLSSIFGSRTPLKTKVLLEKQIIETLTTTSPEPSTVAPVDTLVVNGFCTQFNERYETLLETQRELLQKYIFSFGPNESDFKFYLATELDRLHEAINASLTLPEILEDGDMVAATKKVLEKIGQFNVNHITQDEVLTVLKIQSLVNECAKS